MKKVIITLTVALFTTTAIFAQSTEKEEVDAFQANFGKEKKELISGLIKMTPDQNAKFWPIYDAYEVERKALGKERIDLIKNLGDAYDNMTPEKADAVTSQAIKIARSNDKMLDKYYESMKKNCGSEIAFQFYQAETYINTSIKNSAMEQIPLYSNIKNSK